MTQLFLLQDLQRNDTDVNTFLNRYWFYNDKEEDITSTELLTAYADTFLPVVRATQSTEVRHTALYCKEVLDGVDEVLGTLTGATGGRTADALPDFTQYSFYLKGAGPNIKRGGKRISGVSEDDQNNNVVLGAGIIALLASLAGTYLTGLPVGEIFATHVITRFIPGLPSFLISPIVGAVYRRISTQRSRLAGATQAGSGFIGFTPIVVAESVLDITSQAVIDSILGSLQTAQTEEGTFTAEILEERRY